ncbi:hypothetical protein NGRA_1081 [Nosema granulosis]|uniref:Uncharacterized protein n=1 Tax=Nosema granulosis TaxID=83296 RepID=A0A9P6H2D6_9MICR|nr:hypothetical protein NGRA_1081 [Nosema granulosis]
MYSILFYSFTVLASEDQSTNRLEKTPWAYGRRDLLKNQKKMQSYLNNHKKYKTPCYISKVIECFANDLANEAYIAFETLPSLVTVLNFFFLKCYSESRNYSVFLDCTNSVSEKALSILLELVGFSDPERTYHSVNHDPWKSLCTLVYYIDKKNNKDFESPNTFKISKEKIVLKAFEARVALKIYKARKALTTPKINEDSTATECSDGYSKELKSEGSPSIEALNLFKALKSFEIPESLTELSELSYPVARKAFKDLIELLVTQYKEDPESPEACMALENLVVLITLYIPDSNIDLRNQIYKEAYSALFNFQKFDHSTVSDSVYEPKN